VNAAFRKSFTRALLAVRDQSLLVRVRSIIEAVEQAHSLGEIANLEKITGWKRYYRIRVGDYRVGLVVEGNTVTFVRFLHRRDIYRYFP